MFWAVSAAGPRVLAFDAHIDTVGISNPTHWKYDPFRGVVSGGILFGRGASDQKGGLAAVVHGVALAARIGLPDDFSVWVTATVNGEDCVGLAWQYLVNETDLSPRSWWFPCRRTWVSAPASGVGWRSRS